MRVVMAVASLLCLMLGGGAAATPEAALVIEGASRHDVGRVDRGEVVRHAFKVRNAGSEAISVTGMRFSVPGLKARMPASIPAGQTVDWVVEWETRLHSGEFLGEALLNTANTESDALRVVITGFVVSPIEFDPVPAFYLSQFAGEDASQTIDVRINQERAVAISRAESPDGTAEVTVKPLSDGRHYQVTATASPTLPVGIHFGSAYLFTNDPDRPRIRLEVNIKIKADLHPSAESVELGRLRPAVLRANPEMLEFITGSVTVESRYGKASKLAATVDLDFLEVVAEAGDDDRRLGIELRPKLDQLKPGSYTGTLTVGFAETPETTLRLPVTVVVEG